MPFHPLSDESGAPAILRGMKHPLDLHPRPATRRHRNRRRPARRTTGRDVTAMIVAGLIGGAAWTMLAEPAVPDGVLTTSAPATAAPARAFAICHSGGGRDCVVDGDTFWMDGIKIRIADIDTPETHPARCSHEAELGEAATRRLRELLSGGAIELAAIDRDSDRYGRKLRIVSVDGRGIGDALVREGLARRYEGGRRAGWCD